MVSDEDLVSRLSEALSSVTGLEGPVVARVVSALLPVVRAPGAEAPVVTAPDPDVRATLEDDAFVDRLAAVEHERWAHWQQYLHDRCQRTDDGSLVIPAELAKRWSAQIETPYTELSEAERESDRDQVRRYLPLIIEALTYHPLSRRVPVEIVSPVANELGALITASGRPVTDSAENLVTAGWWVAVAEELDWWAAQGAALFSVFVPAAEALSDSVDARIAALRASTVPASRLRIGDVSCSCRPTSG